LDALLVEKENEAKHLEIRQRNEEETLNTLRRDLLKYLQNYHKKEKLEMKQQQELEILQLESLFQKIMGMYKLDNKTFKYSKEAKSMINTIGEEEEKKFNSVISQYSILSSIEACLIAQKDQLFHCVYDRIFKLYLYNAK